MDESALIRRIFRKKNTMFPWSDSEDEEHPSPISSTAAHGTCEQVLLQEPVQERVLQETALASSILWHCVDVVNAIRRQHGGFQLCIFKIGLTSNPVARRQSYRNQHFKAFVVIHKVTSSALLGQLEMLEAALIAEFYDGEKNCRNQRLGGESMRDKSFHPRFPPPYFAYCAATNASQKELVYC